MQGARLATTAALLLWVTAPAAHAAPGLPISLDALNGFSDASEAKVRQAAQALGSVLGSDEFRNAVLSFAYDGKAQFANNDLADAQGNTVATGLSNEQVYDTLLASRETYLGNTDSEVHLDLTLYTPPFYKKWGVVGYGYPGQPQIFMNWFWFDAFSVAQVAGNLAHEWTHKLGFDHDYKATARRPYSVPYGVGCIVEQLAIGQSSDPAKCAQGEQ
jgi:hypothetical protein